MSDTFVPIRLSHSSNELFNRCERLYQLDKLLATDRAEEATADTVFGTAFGVGVADFLVTQDEDSALYKAWLSYWPELESDKKNMAVLTHALITAFPALRQMLEDYEVVYFKGKPAVELSFRININTRYYYVGYLDVVLRNKHDGVCVALDVKTKGLALYDLTPLYENSAQVLAYSIALDKIIGEAQSAYSVGYFVAQIKKDMEIKIHPMMFRKTLLDRLNWFLTLGGDVQRMELAESIGFYPRRGDACLKYNRPCRHFGVCTLSSQDIPRKREPDTIEYDFVFDLQELIDSHLQRVSA